MFADDVVAIARTEQGMREIMRAVVDFCEAKHLKVNFAKGKTEYLSVMPTQNQNQLPPQKADLGIGSDINRVEMYKYLGLLTTGTGDNRAALNLTIQKSRRATAKLKNMLMVEQWMAPAVRLALLDTAVRSIMLYAAPIWASAGLLENKG